MNYLTAHFALCTRGRLVAGETVLIHGAAGGIGTACIQVGAALGASVVAVVSTPDKARVGHAAGAHHGVSADDFHAETDALAGHHGVDVVIDPVGGSRSLDSLRLLRESGRMMVVGFTSGDIPQVRVNRLLLNNIDVRGVAWGAYASVRQGFVREQWDDLRPHLESGRLSPVVGSTYTLGRAADALNALERRRGSARPPASCPTPSASTVSSD